MVGLYLLLLTKNRIIIICTLMLVPLNRCSLWRNVKRKSWVSKFYY